MVNLSIGRDAANQIVLNESLVSRHHAQLVILDNGQIMIKDLGSTNGTFVNDIRIIESYLNTGDIVKCSTAYLNWQEIIKTFSVNQTHINQPQVIKPNSNQPQIIQQPNSASIIDIIPPLRNNQKSAEEEIVTQPKGEPLENNNEDKLQCPRCRSTNIHIDKKGFGGAKACCGGLACGPLGLLFGTAGASKLRKTCLKCNNSWF